MINKSKNKDMNNAENKENKQYEDYFFAGGLEFKPMNVRATSQAEAEEVWLAERVSINNNN